MDTTKVMDLGKVSEETKGANGHFEKPGDLFQGPGG
jgi:hypothetical protein